MSNWVMINEDDREFLAHSSGPWKQHKYIRKEGDRYIYKQYAEHKAARANGEGNEVHTKSRKGREAMSVSEAKEAEKKRQASNRGEIRKRRELAQRLESNKASTNKSAKVMSPKEAKEAEKKRQVENRTAIRKRRQATQGLGSNTNVRNPDESRHKSGKRMMSATEARDAKKKRETDEFNRAYENGRAHKVASNPKEARDAERKRKRSRHRAK